VSYFNLQNFLEIDSQIPITTPHRTGSRKRQSDNHANLARRGPTRNIATTVLRIAGGNVTTNPMTIMMPGKNGIALSIVFSAIIVNAIEANQPKAQRTTITPKPFAHAILLGLIWVSEVMTRWQLTQSAAAPGQRQPKTSKRESRCAFTRTLQSRWRDGRTCRSYGAWGRARDVGGYKRLRS
jgi:hypothetical protein